MEQRHWNQLYDDPFRQHLSGPPGQENKTVQICAGSLSTLWIGALFFQFLKR
jgi:hypothetical protein